MCVQSSFARTPGPTQTKVHNNTRCTQPAGQTPPLYLISTRMHLQSAVKPSSMKTKGASLIDKHKAFAVFARTSSFEAQAGRSAPTPQSACAHQSRRCAPQ